MEHVDKKCLCGYLLILLLTGLALYACKTRLHHGSRADSEPVLVENSSLSNQYLAIETYTKPFRILVKSSNGKVLLEILDNIRYTTVHKHKFKARVAWQSIKESRIDPWKICKHLVESGNSDGTITLGFSSRRGGDAEVEMKLTLEGRRLLADAKVIASPGINRLALSFTRDDNDTYFGMGERFNSPEHGGSVVRNWAQEGAMGIWNLSRIAPNLSFNPFPLGQDTTYYPVPFFLNAKGYGFLLNDPHFSRWDFGKKKADRVDIVNWNNTFNFILFYGPSPLQVIEDMTALTGRISVPKPWIFAPWNVAISGSKRSREVAQTVRKEKIPTSAIWSEDWWWDDTMPKLPRSKEWKLNRIRYPDFENLLKELHNDGFRYLTYFQPYIFVESDLYREGTAKGYFTMNQDGTPYVINVTFEKKVQLDLTNSEAVKWWQEKLYAKSVEMGVDGWMTDYSEYTPPDSKSHDGRSGWELHNDYTVLWSKITREFFDRARPDGDYAFFVRAGYIGTQKYAPVVWTGDSNANWEKYDGIPSVISAVTSIGISGFPVTATDIAGMHCILSPSTDKELFFRWTELGAMLPVMRNHRGSDFCNNWKFDDDRETLMAYRKYAIIHTALFPYFYTLIHDAAKHGWPVTRHMALHYPDDLRSLETHYQFLVGDRLLIAPVIKDKARKWPVYLPPGEWIDFFTNKKYAGQAEIEVDAPLDYLPLFVKSGTIVPFFDTQIDTLVEENREDLNGWNDANSSIKFVFYGEGKDSFRLWDGTEVVCERTAGKEGSCKILSSAEERKYSFEFK